MHNNYYFLRQLSIELEGKLKGLELLSCFSQNKDEIIFGFSDRQSWVYIRCMLTSDLACLSFPEDFKRSKKNSVDLFPELTGIKVKGVYQYPNDRSFSILFEKEEYALLFKMHGNRSNIILLKENIPVSLFHKKITKDLALKPEELEKSVSFNYEDFVNSGFKVKKLFPTFDEVVYAYLDSIHFDQLKPEDQWSKLQEILKYLEHPSYYIIEYKGKPELSLFNFSKILSTADSAIEAANKYFSHFTWIYFLEKRKQDIIKKLSEDKKKLENYLLKTKDKLKELEEGRKYNQLADLIMANLHLINEKLEEVTLDDFYNDYKPLKIKLKKDIPPQKNAELLYKKGKNQQIELDILRKNIANKQVEFDSVSKNLDKLISINDHKQLGKFIDENHLDPQSKKQQADEGRFKRFIFNGFEILVGKSAANNDLLIKENVHKEDLWLHARDVSGSHVIVKFQSGKKYPMDVIEKAAQLAAFYSKRKNDTLSPVIYTPRKYVRKFKGAAPGEVKVEKEQVLLVPPGNFSEQY